MAKPAELEQHQDPGVRKAAIAVLALGEELAKTIFEMMEPEDIQRVLQTAESIQNVQADEVYAVLEELTQDVDHMVSGVSGCEHLLHEAAQSAIGDEALKLLLSNEVEKDAAKRQLTNLAKNDPVAFGQILSKEHPQVVAVVGAVLPSKIAANVFGVLPDSLKADAVRRIATMREVPTAVMNEVVEAVGEHATVLTGTAPIKIDGYDSAVSVLKAISADQQREVFDRMREVNEELADELRRRMFIFEDIINLHPRDVQRILREIDSQSLPLALKSATEDLRQHILGNMSQRAAEMIVEDMEVLGPVTVRQVVEAQEVIVSAILAMADEGKVNLHPEDSF